MSYILINHLTQTASPYCGRLRAAHRAVAYLKTRDLRGDIAVRCGLGYAPTNFRTLREVFPNYNNRALEKAGLVTVNDGGRRYDCFRNQIMFPILDDAGSVIGFGDRVLEGDESKCFNSPETGVFQKRRVLFGLTQAAKAIIVTGTTYVVEGYLDVVGLAQYGVQNTVIALGMATTGQHVERLLGLAKCVIFCLDGDDAGRRAAVCALGVCLPHVTDAVDVSFLFLPHDRDPDNYMCAKGGDTFNDLVLEASSPEGFFLANTMQGCQLECIENRTRLVATAAPHLQQVNVPAMLRRILTTTAGPSKFSVGELIDLCGLEKSTFLTIDRQQFYGRIQLIGSGQAADEPRKQL